MTTSPEYLEPEEKLTPSSAFGIFIAFAQLGGAMLAAALHKVFASH